MHSFKNCAARNCISGNYFVHKFTNLRNTGLTDNSQLLMKRPTFCHPDAAFSRIDLKLFIKKKDSNRTFDTPLRPFYNKKDPDRETCFRKGILGCSLRLIRIKCGKQEGFRQVLVCSIPPPSCLVVSQSPGKNFAAMCVPFCSSSLPANRLFSLLKSNTLFPPFSFVQNRPYIDNVASLYLEFSWIYYVYVNYPCIEL